MLIDHLFIRIALIVLEEHDSEEVIELSEDGISVLIHSSQVLAVLSKADLLVIKAPVVVVVLDHANFARVSVSPVKVHKVVGGGVSIFNCSCHWIVSDLMVEIFLEFNHWGHPLSKAIFADHVLFRVVPSLDEALVGSSDEGSIELRIGEDISFFEVALDWSIWNLSFDWKEIVWSVHGRLLMVAMMVAMMLLMMTMMTTVMLFVMSVDHLEEVRVSRGNADKGKKSKLIHI